MTIGGSKETVRKAELHQSVSGQIMRGSKSYDDRGIERPEGDHPVVKTVSRRVTTDNAVRQWMADVSKAALSFESRWTWLALRRVNPEMATRLHEQRGFFDQSIFSGNPSLIAVHGAGMIRGYAKVTQVMEEAGEADDAYLLGVDPETGTKVAIGEQKAAVERVRKVHGKDVIWISPDEIAVLFASSKEVDVQFAPAKAFRFAGAVKKLFPGAEVIRGYTDEDEGGGDG